MKCVICGKDLTKEVEEKGLMAALKHECNFLESLEKFKKVMKNGNKS